jgi:hypothetical protein
MARRSPFPCALPPLELRWPLRPSAGGLLDLCSPSTARELAAAAGEAGSPGSGPHAVVLDLGGRELAAPAGSKPGFLFLPVGSGPAAGGVASLTLRDGTIVLRPGQALAVHGPCCRVVLERVRLVRPALGLRQVWRQGCIPPMLSLQACEARLVECRLELAPAGTAGVSPKQVRLECVVGGGHEGGQWHWDSCGSSSGIDVLPPRPPA